MPDLLSPLVHLIYGLLGAYVEYELSEREHRRRSTRKRPYENSTVNDGPELRALFCCGILASVVTPLLQGFLLHHGYGALAQVLAIPFLLGFWAQLIRNPRDLVSLFDGKG